MRTNGFNRRVFLETSGQAAASAVAVVTSGATVMLAPGQAWAMTTLSESQAQALLPMARLLFPHDQLGDQYYAAAIEALDTEASEDDELANQLAEGVGQLNEAMGISFAQLSEGNQLSIIESLEGSDFFNTVRSATLNAIYGNDTVARMFGFEGSSVEYGGYLKRGFDDLGWLPELPDNN